MKIKGSCLILWLTGTLLYGCASAGQPIPHYSIEEGGYYTSTFPSQEVSKRLSRIQQSVQRITSTAIYTIYLLGDKQITAAALPQANLDSIAARIIHIDQSKAGTAVSILQNDRNTIFITAHHITEFPDTLITFKKRGEIPENTYIQSVGIREEKDTYLFVTGALVEVELMAVAPRRDLALLKADHQAYDYYAPPLLLKTGTAKNLRLGSFIYIIGYPLGTPMVTRGIVSAPNYDGNGTFLTDALFNHGISGGLIIASPDRYNSFEWVGMSSTASASRDFFLVPDPSQQRFYRNFDVYTDTAFIMEKSIINYGVARAIPIEDILEFIFSNENKLNNLGLSATDLTGQ